MLFIGGDVVVVKRCHPESGSYFFHRFRHPRGTGKSRWYDTLSSRKIWILGMARIFQTNGLLESPSRIPTRAP